MQPSRSSCSSSASAYPCCHGGLGESPIGSARHRRAIGSGSPSGEVSRSRDSASTMTSDLVTFGAMVPNIKAAWQDPSTTRGEFPDVAISTFCCALENAENPTLETVPALADGILVHAQPGQPHHAAVPAVASAICELPVSGRQRDWIARRPPTSMRQRPSSASYSGSATRFGSRRTAPGRSANAT